MASTGTPTSSSPWGSLQIPRPIQQLFNRFPLVTYNANDLPARTQALTSSSLPTLYVFSTDEDALKGWPSFNPTCLKWQTLLRLTKTPHRILPSTNHASPTGALPFLLPPQSTSSSTKPIPASLLSAYATKHGAIPLPSSSSATKEETYLSLLTPIRNAFLYALYLDPKYSSLLDRLYIHPSSSSTLVRKTLRYQLRSAAAASILQSRSLHPDSGREQIDGEAVFAEAQEALEALAGVLNEREGWFFGNERPGEFDAAVFGYAHLILSFMDEEKGLGRVLREVGEGAIVRHWKRVKIEAGWDI